MTIWRLIVVACSLAIVSTLPSAAFATAPGANGKIFFSARVNGASNDNEILSINADGTGLENVTPTVTHVPFEIDGDNSDPALSGDGSHFVWLTNRCWDSQPTPYCGTQQIGMAAADGSGARRITDLASSFQQTPVLSPDGTKVAFASDRTGCCELWIEDLADGGLTQVTHLGQTNTRDPAFSPDGTKLAYDSVGSVWILDLATGATSRVAGGLQPTWSPDGTQLAFLSSGNEIYRSAPDGSGLTRLTFLGCNEGSPSWSPDGQLIVFHSNCDGGLDVASAVDGSGRHMLIGDHKPFDAVGEPENPDWQTVPAAPPPPPPPTVTSVTPSDGAGGVPTDAVVSATFSRAMDPATITSATFTLVGPSGPVAASVQYDAGSITATLTPSSPLAAGATYTATLLTGVHSADGVALGAPVSWTFTTAGAPPPQPPTVTSTYPADGTTGFATDSFLTATFSRAMDPTTITTGSFLIVGPAGPVATASVDYDGSTNTAILFPSSGLDGLTTYTATLTTAVTAADGVALAAPFSWSFTTAPGPLRVVSSVPRIAAVGVPIDTTVSVTFNKPLDPATVNPSTISFARGPGVAVPFTISYTPGSTTVTLTPTQLLAYSTVYFALVDGVRAADGGEIPAKQGLGASFKTVHAPPAVSVLLPADGATEVSVGTGVFVDFDEPMDFSTIDAASFTLRDPSGTVVPAKVAFDGKGWALTPLAPLAYGTTYTATLDTTIKDVDGFALPAPVSWSFTTTADRTPPIIVPTITGTLGDNGWYTSNVTLTWSVTDPESPSSVSIAPGECADQSITADQADVGYRCEARSFGGANSVLAHIKRDATPPTVSLTGNLRVYTVDADLRITCNAADALSGLAAPCPDIAGPAYSFALGTNIIARTARDNAGNTASATALFTISVTPASLCNLTSRFAGSSDAILKRNVDAIVQAACNSLDVLAKPKKGSPAAYDSHVSALLRGGYITADQAVILEQLATALV